MDGYRLLHRCARLVGRTAGELFTGLATFGAALIGAPLPPEAFPGPPEPDGRAAASGSHPTDGRCATTRWTTPGGPGSRTDPRKPPRPRTPPPAVAHPRTTEPGPAPDPDAAATDAAEPGPAADPSPAATAAAEPGPAAKPGAPVTGHPERLVPHVPPTPEERRLWSQLR